MTRQFVNDNYDLLKNTFDLWLHDAANNAQYGSGIFGGGDVREFERICCQVFHSKYSLAVSSGTAALHVSLISLRVKKNSNVIILGSNWVGLGTLVSACGAVPIYFDHKKIISFLKGYPKQVKSKTILIYVRSHNDASYFKDIHEACFQNNIPIIEDWSALKEINLEKTSAPLYGDFAVFSFGYNKWIQAGEGGIVVLNHKDYFENILTFSQHPISQKAHGVFNTNSILSCLNYRIHPLSARLALTQLNKLLQNNSKRLLEIG